MCNVWTGDRGRRFVAVSMVNGMTVNGLGEVTAINDTTNATSSLLGLGKQLTHYLILGTNLLQLRNKNNLPDCLCVLFVSFGQVLQRHPVLLVCVCGRVVFWFSFSFAVNIFSLFVFSSLFTIGDS